MRAPENHPHRPFHLEDHPELKNDFFSLPDGFEEEFPFALQQRLAQKPRRIGGFAGLGWLRVGAPALVAGLVAVLLVTDWLPIPTAPPDGAVASVDVLNYEAAVEEILLDPVLAEAYLPELTQAAARTTETPQFETTDPLAKEVLALPEAASLDFLENHLQDAVVYEFLDSTP